MGRMGHLLKTYSNNRDQRMKAASFIFFALFFFFALTCKKEPPVVPPPPTGPDTTSHNFTWTQYTFGGSAGSSYFNDVAVINDSDIWAVGQIFANDSTGKYDPIFYNVVHWNGSTWSLLRLKYFPPGAIGDSLIGVGRSIFAMSDNDIWLVADVVYHFDGSSFSLFYNTGAEGAKRIWGNAGGDLWSVGNSGTMAHYSNGAWTKLTSGTSLNIQDIWGGINPTTGQEEILAVASNVAAIPQAKALLQISGNAVTAVNDSGLALALSSVWFIPGWKYFVGGDGLFSTTAIGNSWQVDTTQPLLYKDAIRGTGKNDIFVVGGYGLVSHWNGATWKQYAGNELPSFYGYYQSVSFRNNTVAAVGTMSGSTVDSYAVILVGTRK